MPKAACSRRDASELTRNKFVLPAPLSPMTVLTPALKSSAVAAKLRFFTKLNFEMHTSSDGIRKGPEPCHPARNNGEKRPTCKSAPLPAVSKIAITRSGYPLASWWSCPTKLGLAGAPRLVGSLSGARRARKKPRTKRARLVSNGGPTI